jgi:hypothetical protein
MLLFKQEKLSIEEVKIVQNFIYDTPNIIFYSQKELFNFPEIDVLKAYYNKQ